MRLPTAAQLILSLWLVGCAEDTGPGDAPASGGSAGTSAGGTAGWPGGGAAGGSGGSVAGSSGAGEPSMDVGYYNADTVRWGQDIPVVMGWTNLVYAGGFDAGLSDTPPAERKLNLAALIGRAAQAGAKIMLDIELGGSLTVGDVLMAAQPHWDRVAYVILGDELDMPIADANNEIALLHQRIQNLGLDDSKPIGVTLTPSTTLSSEIVDAAWDFINIEAYTEPCSCTGCGAANVADEVASVSSRVAAMKARIPVATEITIVVQGYDRNGAYTNIPVLAELNRATYFDMAKGDPRVKALVVFSWGREGNQCGTGAEFGFGTRGHAELQSIHQEIWADLKK